MLVLAFILLLSAGRGKVQSSIREYFLSEVKKMDDKDYGAALADMALSEKTVVLTVNGQEIYASDIESTKLGNKYSVVAGQRQLAEVELS